MAISLSRLSTWMKVAFLLMALFCTDLTTNNYLVYHPYFETVAIADVWHCLCYLMGQSRQMLWASWLGKKFISLTVQFTSFLPFIKTNVLKEMFVFKKVQVYLDYSYWKDKSISKSSSFKAPVYCYFSIYKILTSESKFCA